jgi:hypothetical protein
MPLIYVINLSGEREPFSYNKVYNSARRAGAGEDLAKEIAGTVQKQAYPGIKTSAIYEKVKELLGKSAPASAIKFDLKEAMKKLGPSGFPFEKFVGKIFSSRGFQIRLNRHIRGRCASYETDFLAEKKSVLYLGECKYRMEGGNKIDLGVCLGNYARFLDIEKGELGKTSLKIKSLIVTNAKFTAKAEKYSKCTGVELLGWRYPGKKGLESLIEEKKIYPVTILPSVKKWLADILIAEKIILARDILKIEAGRFAKRNKIGKNIIENLQKEAKILLNDL